MPDARPRNDVNGPFGALNAPNGPFAPHRERAAAGPTREMESRVTVQAGRRVWTQAARTSTVSATGVGSGGQRMHPPERLESKETQ